MHGRLVWVSTICLGLPLFLFALLRDIHYTKEYPGDLRNRIVGARIIGDGHSPYFYKWKEGDGLRYYDPDNFDTLKPAVMTSTPFMHRLLLPIANRPQARIAQYWLVLEYLLLAGMTIFAFYCARSGGQRLAVIAVALLFLLTNAWKCQVSHGQYYLLIAAFGMLFYASMRHQKSIGWALIGGTAAACMILIRPYAILFLIPLALSARGFSRRWLLASLIPGLLLAGWILTSSRELDLWKDYAHMLQEQLKVHQDLPHEVRHNAPDPHYRYWEGLDMSAVDDQMRHTWSPVHSENGNVFVLYRLLLHRKLSVTALGLLCMTTIIGLTALWYFLRRSSGGRDITRMAIFGFCLYMIADLFSPIYRHQYYTVQWIFPLLLAAAIWSPQRKRWYGALLIGLLLSIIHFPFVKMGNTIGEYLILLALLAISLLPGTPGKENLQPASLS
ncbi:MAG: hypothetical protein BGO55_17145 [Sphingobacteriales bacterium 50-39]|nr:hypothetical protein [Sphingobacteriales bacterium]MBN9322967.1 hypothetical protein [Delftia acidovorans]OJW60194.1 MAG: hypothetical protein BGO55_17145 [Sphingobacteriales bacterium 50-39]